MPPKKSKKNAEKEKQKIVEDKTFGLKNKNKSKRVQKYVDTVKKQAQHKVDGPRRRSATEAGSSSMSATQKQLMAARLAELDMMNQAVKAKTKKLSAEEEEKRRKEEEEEAERTRIANLPVEDQIEEERAKLEKKTPVTHERFLEWKKRKDIERKARLDAERANALKGVSKAERARGQGLTGRELFESHQNLFVDDEGADTSALKAASDYIGSDAECETEEVKGDKKADEELSERLLQLQVDPNESLLGAHAAASNSEEVAVGDESLFS